MKMERKHWVILIILILIGGFILKFVGENYFKIEVEEPWVGGCAGVHMDYWQECCETWAQENDIVHIQCVGNWTVGEEGVCGWVCSS